MTSTLPNTVKIVEVGPRDGLQNEKAIIPTNIKIELINRLSKTGLQSIEVTSFVSPKRIPQLSDAKAVLSAIDKPPHIHFPVLVPNQHGMKNAIDAGAKEVAVFTAASETFSKKNTECSIEESFERIHTILKIAKPLNIPVRGYISCALGCPYEGYVNPDKVLQIAARLIDLGCYEISLGDTIGVGTPLQAQTLIKTLTKTLSIHQLAVHFHDTYGQALANIFACLQLGIKVIDSAIAGLGGCPYAKGATGNVATEDVLYMLQGLNIETGINLNEYLKVTQFVSECIKRPPHSKVAIALLGDTKLDCT